MDNLYSTSSTKEKKQGGSMANVSVVYTYKNKKMVLYKIKRFWKIESKKQYNSIINKLVSIDAVFTSNRLTYDKNNEPIISKPIWLEVQDGFGFTLELVKESYVSKELNRKVVPVQQVHESF